MENKKTIIDIAIDSVRMCLSHKVMLDSDPSKRMKSIEAIFK